MNPTVDASYREAASTLKPQAVSEYLAVSPWNLERRDDLKEIWQLRSATGEPLGRLMLPLATNYTDFADRFYDAILTLGRVNDWDADQLLEQILATRADLFFVRLDQSISDGTIPFKQAETTIEAIYSMVRSAAARAAGSRVTRRGNLPAAAENYLDDDVRLGHTKRGSFVFTVASRLNDRITVNRSLTDVDADSASGTIFSRRVMEILAASLEAARDLAVHEPRTLGDFYNFRTNLDLVESLEEIAKPQGLRSVELSFQWAAAIPRPFVGTEPIKLDHRDVSILSEFRRQTLLEAIPETVHNVTLIGRVVSLARSNAEEESNDSGEVVIIADVGGGRFRQVRVPLSGQDHDLAIQAYRSRRPLSVSGNLVLERQRWRLTGDVELNSKP